jgi:hypothetical protein
MPNGRCRLHGGKSTGPRTAAGLERCRTANWKHGFYCKQALMRIPLKWGTNSGEVGQRRSEATLVTAMISDVPHISQEFCW